MSTGKGAQENFKFLCKFRKLRQVVVDISSGDEHSKTKQTPVHHLGKDESAKPPEDPNPAKKTLFLEDRSTVMNALRNKRKRRRKRGEKRRRKKARVSKKWIIDIEDYVRDKDELERLVMKFMRLMKDYQMSSSVSYFASKNSKQTKNPKKSIF